MCHLSDISDPSDSLDQVQARIVEDMGKPLVVEKTQERDYLPLIPYGIEYLSPMDKHDFQEYLERKEDVAIHYSPDDFTGY